MIINSGGAFDSSTFWGQVFWNGISKGRNGDSVKFQGVFLFGCSVDIGGSYSVELRELFFLVLLAERGKPLILPVPPKKAKMFCYHCKNTNKK